MLARRKRHADRDLSAAIEECSMNRSPLNAVTAADAETYAREGAVVLRGVLDRAWIDALLPVAKRLVVDGEDMGLLPHRPANFMSRVIPEFRELALNSPVGEAAGRTIGSTEVRFFFDQIFAKPPRSDAKTVWHSDRGGWAVTGQMVPSVWLPLTPVVPENSLEVIAGSHKNDVTYWNMTANSRQMIMPPDRLNVPDGEAIRGDTRYVIKRWSMEPGDALIIHPWALHYSSGNPTDDWRIAVSIRPLGDDTRWDPRPECVNIAGLSFDEMIPGERPRGPLVPLIWSEDGRREDVDRFPSGFGVRWEPDARARLANRPKARSIYEDEVRARGGPSAVPLPVGVEDF